MNGEVSLIVRVESAGGPGNTVIDTTGGYTEFGTLTIFMLGDMTVYIGHYVQITSTLTGVIGTFELATATYDGTTWSTVTFVGWTPIEVESLTYQIYSLAASSQEYYLDLFENESISQNWQYTDLNNFQALGAFSREFRIPVTDRNQLALGALFDVNYDGGINNYFHYKLPAEIRVDTLPIAKGYVRVRKIYQQQGKLNEVELAFYAETPDLYKAIGEKKLAALTDLPNLNEVVNYDNVTTTLVPQRKWTLIDRGQLWSEQGQPNTRPILDSTQPLYAVDLTPAVRWDYLLEQIFADAGFELEAGSLLTILGGYYMPWINKSYLDTDDLGSQYAFRAYNSTNVTLPSVSGQISAFYTYASLTEEFDNNANFDAATGTYTTPAGGLYTFHVSLNVTTVSYGGAATHTRILIYFNIDGTDFYIEDYFYQGFLNIDFNYGLTLLSGSTVQLRLRTELGYFDPIDNGWIVAGTGNISLVAGNGTLSTTMFELIGTKFLYGSTFIYNLNAPDMRQIDFVNDVIKMHNCVIVPDRVNPKKITVVPYNSYIGSGDDKDWNSKLDISKDITIYSTVELQKNKTTFTYTAGEDYLSKFYKDNGRIYGDYKAEGYTINPDITPSEFTTGDNSVQLVTRSTPCGNIPGTNTAIPQFINDKNEFVVPGPRCLFSAYGAGIQVFDDSAGVEAAVTTNIPILLNYNTANPDLYDYDLNWAPEVPPFQITVNPYNNLFNLYWRNAMNELYSPNSRIMEAYFALDLSDILTFKFNDIIYVNGAQWRILEITDYKVGQFESTRVKLMKYLRTEADCSSTPGTISTNGVVNFVDGNGDPVASTQSCCVRYGYSWSENDAECYAFNQGGDRPSNGITGTNTNPIPRNSTPASIDGNTRSVQQGVALDIVDGNNNMLAVGDTLKLDTAVRGNAMIGKNVLIGSSGFHIGGGWKQDDRTQPEGSTQHGIIMHGDEFAVTISGVAYQIPIENIPNNFLSIPDESVWHCLMHVVIYETGNIGNYYAGLHQVNIQKSSGNAIVNIQPTLISEENAFGGGTTFGFTIDTSADPTQHRLEITPTTGYTLPIALKTTIALQYTAVR
jgi:hypothetical protein